MAAKEKEALALPEGQAEKPKKRSRLKHTIIIAAILLMTLSAAGLRILVALPAHARSGRGRAGRPGRHGPGQRPEQGAADASAGHGATPAGQTG